MLERGPCHPVRPHPRPPPDMLALSRPVPRRPGVLATVLAAALATVSPAALRAQTPAPGATAATTTAPAVAPARSRAALVARLDSLARRAQQEGPIAGMTVGVVRGRDTLLLRGYGMANLEQGTPAAANSVYRIGSITKQFTAAAVMRLVEQGRVALDDPITKYLPQAPVQGRTVLVRHLLNHTSGLRSYTDLGPRWTPLMRQDLTPDSLVGLTRTDSVEFEPGTRWKYNNTGYVLLGMLIEKVTGRPWADVIRDSVARPLGLADTRYCSTSEVIPRRADGYEPAAGRSFRHSAYISMTQPYAAGALCSTVPDLLRWQRALSTGKVVAAASYARMSTPDTLASTHTPLQYGFGLQVDRLHGRARVYHNGGIPGFVSELHAFPDDSLVIVVLTNTAPSNPGRLARNLARATLGIGTYEVPPPPPRELAALDAAGRAPFVGDYEIRMPTGATLPLRLFEQDGALMAQARGQPALRLLHQGNRVFVSESGNLRMQFVVEDGRATRFTLYQGALTAEGTRVASTP